MKAERLEGPAVGGQLRLGGAGRHAVGWQHGGVSGFTVYGLGFRVQRLGMLRARHVIQHTCEPLLLESRVIRSRYAVGSLHGGV